MRHPVYEVFDMPFRSNLHELFCESDSESQIIGNINPIAYQKIKGFLGAQFMRMFSSKNAIEFKTEIGSFKCVFPLTSLFLFKLPTKEFVGIVSFNEIFYQMRSFATIPALIIDSHNVINGFTKPLLELLNIDYDDAPLIGMNINDILKRENYFDAIKKNEDERSNHDFNSLWLEWNNNLPFEYAFIVDKTGNFVSIKIEKEGFLWENKHEIRSSCIRLVKEIDISNNDVLIELEFVSIAGSPNVILCGDAPELIDSSVNLPDGNGYNIAYHDLLGKSCIQIKDKTSPVFNADSKKIKKDEYRKFSIIIRGGNFTLKDSAGADSTWFNPNSGSSKKNTNAYLFLRPEQSVIIKSLKVFIAEPTKKENPPNKERILTLGWQNKEATFRTSEVNASWEGHNIRLLLLTDISELHANIDSLKNEGKTLRKMLIDQSGLIGLSPSIVKIKEKVKSVADSKLSILIEGETGTGKEILAKYIHTVSSRADKPFVKLDCSAIPASLIESELFGHEKGAFTGAVSSHIGRFEQANGGTLFLDEVSNLPLSSQAKLLGVIQDHEVYRLGGRKSIKLDIRIISASNESITEQIDKGCFRSDLYYRLNQYHVSLPPLRQRKEDIPILVSTFISEGNAVYNKNVLDISPEALTLLMHHSWPGNIRELRSVIIRAVIDSAEHLLLPEHFDIQISSKSESMIVSKKIRKKRTVLSCDQNELCLLLEEKKGNINAIMEQMNLSRPSVYKLLKKYGLTPDEYRCKTVC